uniref:AlNc14C31G2885 protein n=1 Tax=Albugo laibachii Nc14 TaxID=890382 RepID=F0W7T2_9STRA|nr:AlNc14C31G2885 [Albugo laibachii Nc14]|eukprot:CCA17184.1 AlNc14C31G2885 [Albugo laibachii Nc14]
MRTCSKLRSIHKLKSPSCDQVKTAKSMEPVHPQVLLLTHSRSWNQNPSSEVIVNLTWERNARVKYPMKMKIMPPQKSGIVYTLKCKKNDGK